MNQRIYRAAFGFALAVTSIFVDQACGATIAQWDFNTIGVQAAPYNNPAPTTGAGTAVALGMTNSFNGGNTNSDDVASTPGTANPAFVENAWRVRGTPSNGWAAAAPQYSQGIEIDASTVGFQNIQFAFDWYSTAQGIRDLQFQYNTNVANSAGWTNFAGTSPTGTYVAVAKDWYNAPGTNTPMISIDLSSIAGANNDPNFGVRLVAAYDSTGHLGNEFASSTLSSGVTVQYNGTSGNWRFDNMTVTGTPVPEPSTVVLAAMGLAGAAVYAWNRRRKPQHLSAA